MTLCDINLVDRIKQYYKLEATRLEAEIKKDLGFNPNFEQGTRTIKEYAIKLGEFKLYLNQRREADNKLEEIIKELKTTLSGGKEVIQ